MDAFARALVGDDAPQAVRDLATAAAQAQLEPARIQHQKEENPRPRHICGDVLPIPQAIDRLGRIERYQCRAERAAARALRRLTKLRRLPIFK